MARLLSRHVEEPRPCSYLPDRLASLESEVLAEVSAVELEARLVRGFRRFGFDYFRPACGACSECVPTRIPVASFAPSKSQRRAARACDALSITLGSPRVDDARIDLYHRWHAFREDARGWSPMHLDARSYFMSFAVPHPAARELSYYEGPPEEGRLVGVALCDQTPNAWSAIYFFYEPEWAARSIGVANVVFQVAVARQMKIPHVYLGYLVERSRSMAYKARFRPQERLVGWPELDEEPLWIAADAPQG